MAASEVGRLIVVAVDQGEESLYSLTWCLNNVVQNSQVTLVLVYAKPSPTVYPSMYGSGFYLSSDIMTSMDRYGNEMADTVIEKAKRTCANYPNVKVETKVETGDPRDVICEVVEKLNADMLVMGSHGYGPIKRAFLGSVSSHCAQNMKRPVIIVKRGMLVSLPLKNTDATLSPPLVERVGPCVLIIT